VLSNLNIELRKLIEIFLLYSNGKNEILIVEYKNIRIIIEFCLYPKNLEYYFLSDLYASLDCISYDLIHTVANQKKDDKH